MELVLRHLNAGELIESVGRGRADRVTRSGCSGWGETSLEHAGPGYTHHCSRAVYIYPMPLHLVIASYTYWVSKRPLSPVLTHSDLQGSIRGSEKASS